MKMKTLRYVFHLVCLAGLCGLSGPALAFDNPQPAIATGIVYHDANGNKKLDDGEARLEKIKVSNGREIVVTNAEGRYELPVGEDTTIFVIKPSGWANPLSDDKLPQFYYIHKPNGSPANFRYKGVEPTGPLPASIDFPLHPQPEPDQFRAILFGDPQPRDAKEVDYIAHDVVEELIGADASFGVTLGDIAFDDLSTFKTLNEAIALIGIPWYNVIGNHDINYDAADDEHSDETFESVYGPAYYSFDYGQVHFLVLDDIEWYVDTADQKRKYRGGLGKRQMEFIKNDLDKIPLEQMVVLMMHIPIIGVEDRQDLYRLIEKRPFCISISGHTHHHEHRFVKREDGWLGAEPHHHIINVTVSGSWWSGARDERGIPHTIMADGAPNGYSIISFDGQKYKLDFKAAGRDDDYQMQIFAPASVPAGQLEKASIYVNVFNGSERTKVEMRHGHDGEWIELKRLQEIDPSFEAIFLAEDKHKDKDWTALPKPKPSTHLWRAALPSSLPAGTQLLEIRAVEPSTDKYEGHTYFGKRVIRVETPAAGSKASIEPAK